MAINVINEEKLYTNVTWFMENIGPVVTKQKEDYEKEQERLFDYLDSINNEHVKDEVNYIINSTWKISRKLDESLSWVRIILNDSLEHYLEHGEKIDIDLISNQLLVLYEFIQVGYKFFEFDIHTSLNDIAKSWIKQIKETEEINNNLIIEELPRKAYSNEILSLAQEYIIHNNKLTDIDAEVSEDYRVIQTKLNYAHEFLKYRNILLNDDLNKNELFNNLNLALESSFNVYEGINIQEHYLNDQETLYDEIIHGATIDFNSMY